MSTVRNLSQCLLRAMAIFMIASTALADPLPGRDQLKFSQKPMIATPIPDTSGVVTTYGGHDELSTAYGFTTTISVPPQDYSGRFMADDFADNLSSPVVHVKWWGSYHNDVIHPQMPVDKFLISFESDMPAQPGGFSRPDQPLLNQVVTRANALTPGSGTFTEKLIRGPDPVVNESLYEYNAELHLGKDFPEQKDTVYWLKIVAMVDVIPGIVFPTNAPPPFVTQWGWHNRDYTMQNTLASPNVSPGEQTVGAVGANTPVWHFQDDAVTGDVRILPGSMGFLMPQVFQPAASMLPTNYLDFADGPGPNPIVGTTFISQFSKDLAFELYTVPEPGTLVISIGAMAGIWLQRRRVSCSR